ncbi:TetR/AcrR family transcriptional regulator [Nocardia wallacei]|uniref:Putative transcriptional regulator, TetR family protein n=1 Tax=Nocardia wallacei TaxID=480035 RepID=A0A7G1KJC7_9NOCA|nr:TetR/AcrR family transcriptional regulator [Nocardia wallacei]BCK55325.1 putative transcriptional regulator, TetR family protein [Nocardia wallacei]
MDPRKQRTIESLVRAGEEIFAEQGVEETTVEEIAGRAGVAVGSIYNHFGSKAGLHAAVVERALGVDRNYMDRAYTTDRTPIEQLYAAAEEYLEFYLAYPEYFRMLAFPGAPGQYAAGQDLADRLASAVAQQNRRMVEALRAGIAAAVIRPVDPDAVATVLWACWNGVISLGWRPDSLGRDESELRSLLRTATDLVARGLLPRGDDAAHDPGSPER